MKLTAFNIKNFRSIVDTGFCELATDNIAGLIGQNESGKSAILEALFAFYTHNIEDDYLRSGGEYPEVTCYFSVTKDEINNLFNSFELPRGVLSNIERAGWRIGLTRKWSGIEKENTTLEISDESLKELLAKNEPEDPAEEPSVQEEVPPTEEDAQETSSKDLQTKSVEVKDEKPLLNTKSFIDKFGKKIPEFVKFTNYASFLPASIDLEDIVKDKKSTEGIIGAKNFLALTGLMPTDIINKSHRRAGVKIRTANKTMTTEFRKFWQQYIGKEENKIGIEVEPKNYDESDEAKKGKPYLVFWVKNGDELLHPGQRSLGVQWFLSFYLQLKASALPGSKDQILLIDEPGESLHAKAQKDILKVFESTKDQLQIIYTTHSPYLIQAKTIYRLLAVQRSEEGDSGETIVYNAHDLGSASRDTLFPIYSLIGVDLQHQTAIKDKNNIILEEPSAFYYLMSFFLLSDEKHEANFLPATGVTNIHIFVNLFLGWGLEFIVLTDEDQEGKKQLRKIRDEVYGGNTAESKKHLLHIKGCEGIEDIFTKSDFRKYILNNELAKLLPAIKFYQVVKANNLKFNELSSTTQKNISNLINDIVEHLNILR
jgi:AAA15 family ATPase/GTPase